MKAFVVEEPRSRALRALNYAPAVERIRRAGSSSTRSLREIIKAFGPGYGTAFARRECSPAHGVELLSQSDVFAAEPQGRVIRRDSMPHPDRHLVERGQVLIAGVGTLQETELYGRSILADERLAGKYLSQDAMALTFEEPDSDFSLYTYAWLASPTGVSVLRSTSYGTKLLRFRRDLLSTIPVPSAPNEVVSRIATLIRTCSERREQSLRELLKARRMVDAIPEVQAAHEMCSQRRRRTVLWEGSLPSLSAWNSASSGGALRYLRDRWSGTLRDVVRADGIFNGPRFRRVDCRAPHGVEFMSQRDVMLIRPVPRRIVHPAFEDWQLFAREGTILVGGHGTLGEGEIFGRAALVHGRFARAAFTQDLLRVVPKEEYAYALYAFLTTTVGFRLLRSTAVGTKILSMREDMLRALPVPDWPGRLKGRVSRLVRTAFDMRDEADCAEAEAIRIVEQEVLPQWLA